MVGALETSLWENEMITQNMVFREEKKKKKEKQQQRNTRTDSLGTNFKKKKDKNKVRLKEDKDIFDGREEIQHSCIFPR